jgi:hypothetical protein
MARRNKDSDPQRSTDESGERDLRDARPSRDRQQGDGYRGSKPGDESSGEGREASGRKRNREERQGSRDWTPSAGDEPQRREGMRTSEGEEGDERGVGNEVERNGREGPH